MENRDINDRIHESAGTFIAECDHEYRQQLNDAWAAYQEARTAYETLTGEKVDDGHAGRDAAAASCRRGDRGLQSPYGARFGVLRNQSPACGGTGVD